MINNERELEDYICNNQEEFICELKKIFGENNQIEFVGRQVKLGDDNIVDLLYSYEKKYNEEKVSVINFIVVELKFRQLIAKDLGQLSRYVNILRDKTFYDEEFQKRKKETSVYGVFVSFGLDDDMQNISMTNSDEFFYIKIKSRLKFEQESWSYKEDYIDNIKLDKRIYNLLKGE